MLQDENTAPPTPAELLMNWLEFIVKFESMDYNAPPLIRFD